MKRILSICVSVMILMTSLQAWASDTIDEASYRLAVFDVIDVKDYDKTVTRADALSALIKLVTNNADLSAAAGNEFTDVPADHPAAGYIYYAKHMGYASGVSADLFAPDNPVTLQQFTKFACCVMGYMSVAEEAGGYVGGYYATASKMGLLKNVSIEENAIITIGDMIILLSNMLDALTLESDYSGGYKLSELTLYEQLMLRRDYIEIYTTVDAVGPYYTAAGSAVEDDEIMANGMVFQNDINVSHDLLGREIILSYRMQGRTPVVVGVYATLANKTVDIPTQEIEELSAATIKYFDSGKERYKTESLSQASFVYNGNAIDPSSVTKPYSGTVTLLDNNGNGSWDIVFINEYESFIIDRVSASNNTLYFADDMLYRGKSGFKFDYQDSDKHYVLLNANGEAVDFETIEAGMVVSLQSNIPETLVTAIVSGNVAEGVVNEVDSTNHFVTIDEEVYSLYHPNAYFVLSKVTLGKRGTFALDYKGEIVGVSGELNDNRLVGYVTGFSASVGLSAPKIQLIGAADSEKIIKKNGDEEEIQYIYVNGLVNIYDFNDRVQVSLNGSSSEKISADSLTSGMFERGYVFYELSEDNKIKSIDIYTVPDSTSASSSYTYLFNGELNAFGGNSINDPFFVGSTTSIICVPQSSSPSLGDYDVDVTLADKSSYTIVPLEIDEDSQIAKGAVILAKMNSGELKALTDEDVSIVGKVTHAADEKGEIYYRLEVLTGNTVETPYIYEGSGLEGVVKNLKCGDLIRYNTMHSGEIGNLEKLESLAGLGDKYYIERENLANEAAYGKANSIEFRKLDNTTVELTDKLEIRVSSISSRCKMYNIFCEDGPTVYSYNRKSGEIKVATTDEITTYDRVGEGATDVFVLSKYNTPQVVVIMTD